jgi:L-2-hydroxyglutarate oxidase
MKMKPDFLIIGGGIIGLTIARALRQRHPDTTITIIEKEDEVARHGSGRNSGVLHAGFYYTADSLKARFCRDGSRAMRRYCEERALSVNPCRKLVVASSPEEAEGLKELKRRGDANGVEVELIGEREAEAIEPNVQTWGQALYSPHTATVNPVEICRHMRAELEAEGVTILTGHPYHKRLEGNRIQAGGQVIDAGMIINCAGLYADVIAKDFGFSGDYTIIPFKGIYLKYKGSHPPLKTNLYPVPNLKNPFLGVHFTITVDGTVKIGPTAIPAFWRENYKGLQGIKAGEIADILRWQASLLATNAFGFRHLAYEEMRKYNRKHLVGLARKMVKTLDEDAFSEWSTPGIRAQLLRKDNLSLVQDFVVEGDAKSVHVLNAVSPAFTCSLPFAEWVVERWAA